MAVRRVHAATAARRGFSDGLRSASRLRSPLVERRKVVVEALKLFRLPLSAALLYANELCLCGGP